jgi:hypothetical protein
VGTITLLLNTLTMLVWHVGLHPVRLTPA